MQLSLASLATNFMTSAPTIDFGDPGITVTKTVVNSDTSLTLSVDITPTAKFGAHTLTVTSAGQTLKLNTGFTVVPQLTAEPTMSAPSAPQGGPIVYDLRNQDYVANPFYGMGVETLSGNNLYLPDAMAALSFFGTRVTTFSRLTHSQLVDPVATPGPALATVQGKDPFGTPISYYLDPADPSLPQIKARTPTAITFGTTLTGQSFLQRGASNLYSFNNDAATNLLLAQYTNFSAAGLMTGYTAPASGKFKDGMAIGSVLHTAAGVQIQTTLGYVGGAGNTYLSLFRSDFEGCATCKYDVTFRSIPAATFSAKEPALPDTATKPLATVTLNKTTAPTSADGSIEVQTDVDYFQYTAPAAGDAFIMITSSALPSSVPLNLTVFSDSKCSVPIFIERADVSGGILLHDTMAAGALTHCIALSGAGIYPTPYKIAFVTP